MSRLDKVREENKKIAQELIMYEKDKWIAVLLKQISETLAMIYDDGFAEEIVIAKKIKEEDEEANYRCIDTLEHCEYDDAFGFCESEEDCMYKQRQKND